MEIGSLGIGEVFTEWMRSTLATIVASRPNTIDKSLLAPECPAHLLIANLTCKPLPELAHIAPEL
jgi:hypothetical protein